MTKLRGACRVVAIVALAFSVLLLLSPSAKADIAKIQDATACSGTPPGGTICSNGSGGLEGSGGTPFLLSDIEDGSVVLPAVLASVPTYEISDNTGATFFTLVFTGSLGNTTGAFVNCQEAGGFSGDTCSITGMNGTGSGTATFTPNNGTNTTFTVTFSLAGIPTTGPNANLFDLTFPSFSNGASGTATGVVPEPSSLLLVATGLLGLAGFARRRMSL